MINAIGSNLVVLFWILGSGNFSCGRNIIVAGLPTILWLVVLATDIGTIPIGFLWTNFVLECRPLRLLAVSRWVFHTFIDASLLILGASKGRILNDSSSTNCYTAHVFWPDSTLINIAPSRHDLLLNKIIQSLLILILVY